MRHYRPLLFPLIVVSVLVIRYGAHAQDLNADLLGEEPIRVTAERTLEWRKSDQTIRAVGDATATQGSITARGDVLVAHYHPGGSDGALGRLARIEAFGTVTISADQRSIRGEKAVYDAKTGLVVVSGTPETPVILTTPRGTLIANEAIVYDTIKLTARASGGIQVRTADGRTLTARTIIAYMQRGDGGPELDRFEARGDMTLSTPSGTARGSHGDYNVRTGLATITGQVTITNDQATLHGEQAIIDMQTGTARLLGGSGRAQAIFVPESR